MYMIDILKSVIQVSCLDINYTNSYPWIQETDWNSDGVSPGCNALYGGLSLVLNRTVFPNGSIDPWSALGITTTTRQSELFDSWLMSLIT